MNVYVVRLKLVVFLAASTWLICNPAYAVKFWKNSVPSGNWSTGNNWSAVSAVGVDNGGVPVASEPVRIVHTDGVARSISLDTNPPGLGLLAVDLTGAGTAANNLSLTSGNNLNPAALFLGGHNGVSATSGRGALTHSAGTLSMSAGSDFVIAHGGGSAGTYNLNGTGVLNIPQSMYVGLSGTGTVHHSAGTISIASGAIGSFDVAVLPGSTGHYNLSGSGQITSNKSEYIGDQGSATFTQTGGSNTITGTSDLYLGYGSTGNGIYTISGGKLNVNDDVLVGQSGLALLSISGTGDVYVGDRLSLSNGGTLNLSGGKLRLNSVNPDSLSVINYSAGTVQLTGDRLLNTSSSLDLTLNRFFPPSFPNVREIATGKELVVEGTTRVTDPTFVSVNGGKLKSLGALEIGHSLEYATLFVAGGGSVEVAQCIVGQNGLWGTVEVVDGSTFQATNGLHISSSGGPSLLSVAYDSFVDAGSSFSIGSDALVSVVEGKLRFNSYSRAPSATIDFRSGEIQIARHLTIGADPAVRDFFGESPLVPVGKTLTVQGIATLATTLVINRGHFKTNSLVIGADGDLDFQRGILEINGGVIQGLPELIVPTHGEYRGRNEQSIRIIGSTGSTMTATGDWVIGEVAYTDGFYTNGKLNLGPYYVRLQDANDAVLDSGARVTMGSGLTGGVLDAPNGLTLDFGGNIEGFGSITTPNDITKPFINNGHLYGTTAGITLPGYVKGVGTLSNVIITGTLAPGLSPTSLQIGSLVFGNTSRLVMELGGTSPGSGYDQLLSSGSLALGGTLEVQLLGSFSPSSGQSFNLFDWISVSGTFSSLALPSLGAGLVWDTSQLYTAGILAVTAAAPVLPGDYNQDGTVDAADYVVWRNGLGTTHTQADYNTWRANFGRSFSFGASDTQAASNVHGAVPEPGALRLMIFAIAGLVCGRRR